MQLSCISLFMKKTKIRESLINTLRSSNSPLPVSQILMYLKKENPRINKTTTYRDLDLLITESEVEEVDFGEGKKRYHTFQKPHHHLLCQKCGTVEEVECEDKYQITKIQNKFN